MQWPALRTMVTQQVPAWPEEACEARHTRSSRRYAAREFTAQRSARNAGHRRAYVLLDHRLNCRTVYFDPINRFTYWNMNYHREHHMFSMVPYHALPALHEEIKDQCPPAYNGLWHAYREIVLAILRQLKDPGYFVRRELPAQATPHFTP
jgi:fatty acid desaturase